MPFQITEEQKRCLIVDDKNLLILAGAGSGKTTTISKRCVALIEKGISPSEIVAFTFTNNAAVNLRSRIEKDVIDAFGIKKLSELSKMFIGTIHSYCLETLKEVSALYENFDLADDHMLTGILSKEYEDIGLVNLGNNKHWETIQIFLSNCSIVYNELVNLDSISNKEFVDSFKKVEDLLFDFKLLTFDQIITITIKEITKQNKILNKISHLIVDEYQDINPAQEELIRIMISINNSAITVVGDDLQAIYQWRGSDISNILTFEKRYKNVRKETLSSNFRSRESIVKLADQFSKTINPRASKILKHEKGNKDCEIEIWGAISPQDEAKTIAKTIKQLIKKGYRYEDCVILLRSLKTSSQAIVNELQQNDIPYQVSGSTGLFYEEIPHVFSMIYAWLANQTWKRNIYSSNPTEVTIDLLIILLSKLFSLDEKDKKKLKSFLLELKSDASVSLPSSLIRDFYSLLNYLKVESLDVNKINDLNKVGSIARYSKLLGDFEYSMQRRGHNRGRKFPINFYFKLYNYLQFYAINNYEGFGGEETYNLNAVTLMTIHQAKGLEWPIVFIPCLTDKRFPSSNTGKKQNWLVDTRLFSARRYEGNIMDERRLFFVAVTRAKYCVYISTFNKLSSLQNPSEFILDLNNGQLPFIKTSLPTPEFEKETDKKNDRLLISLSEINLIDQCAYQYRLRTLLGFVSPISVEIGYGNAIHHIFRNIVEYKRHQGRLPNIGEISGIIEKSFFLPYASDGVFLANKTKVAKVIIDYFNKFKSDFNNTEETEFPLNVYYDNCTIKCRIDAILRVGNENIIKDFKTSVFGENAKYQFQLGVYSLGFKELGKEVYKCYLDDITELKRLEMIVDSHSIKTVKKKIDDVVFALQENNYTANPNIQCKKCDVNKICISRKP